MPLPLKIALSIMSLLMVIGVIYVLDNSVSGPDDASLNLPSSIERLIPASGSTVLSQSSVGIDLKQGYNAYLVVEGQKIDNDATEANPDGLFRTPSLEILEYDPAPDKRVKRLSSPRACVDAFVWRVEESPATAQQTTWCFNVG
ncbi:MAG TPA: hypothetical protein DEG43_15330 [Acidimicrobiaceae bacterium]|nr:hypothetical protein [Acidimicrobiaceae bacterium]